MNSILIIGGTGNVGFNLIRELLNRYNVIYTSRSRSTIEELENILSNQDYSGKLYGRILDLTSQKSIEDFYFSIKQINKNIHNIVICSGVDSDIPIDNFDFEELNYNISVNFLGPVNLLSKLVKDWLSDGCSGNIVNISSLCAIRGQKNSSIYSASKAAMEAFVRNLSIELAPRNIISNTIRIAATGSIMNKKDSKSKVKNGQSNSYYDLEKIPTNEIINYRSLANLIEFLIENKGIVGQDINFDQGLSTLYPFHKNEN